MVPRLDDMVKSVAGYLSVIVDDYGRFGWISMLTSIVFMNGTLVLGLAELENPSYTQSPWHLTLTIWALVLFQAAVNIWAYHLIPVIEIILGVLHIVLFLVVLVILCTMGEKHSARYVFTDFVTSSGWGNGFVSFNVGMLPFIWMRKCDPYIQNEKTTDDDRSDWVGWHDSHE